MLVEATTTMTVMMLGVAKLTCATCNYHRGCTTRKPNSGDKTCFPAWKETPLNPKNLVPYMIHKPTLITVSPVLYDGSATFRFDPHVGIYLTLPTCFGVDLLADSGF